MNIERHTKNELLDEGYYLMKKEDIILAENKIRDEYQRKINKIILKLEDFADDVQYEFGYGPVYRRMIKYAKELRENNV